MKRIIHLNFSMCMTRVSSIGIFQALFLIEIQEMVIFRWMKSLIVRFPKIYCRLKIFLLNACEGLWLCHYILSKHSYWNFILTDTGENGTKLPVYFRRDAESYSSLGRFGKKAKKRAWTIWPNLSVDKFRVLACIG